MEDLHDAVGRAREKPRTPLCQEPDVLRVKGIHVLAGVDGVQNALGGKLCRQRKLDQNPMHGGIGVELRHPFQQLAVTRPGIQAMQAALDAHSSASPLLVPHVNVARRIVTHQYRRQTRSYAAALDESGHLSGQLALDFLSETLSVQQHRTHVARLSHKTRIPASTRRGEPTFYATLDRGQDGLQPGLFMAR